MKRLLIICTMTVLVLTGCKNTGSDEKVAEQNKEVAEQSSITDEKQVEPVAMAIDGVEYRFPCKLKDFYDNGWTNGDEGSGFHGILYKDVENGKREAISVEILYDYNADNDSEIEESYINDIQVSVSNDDSEPTPKVNVMGVTLGQTPISDVEVIIGNTKELKEKVEERTGDKNVTSYEYEIDAEGIEATFSCFEGFSTFGGDGKSINCISVTIDRNYIEANGTK